MLSPRAPACAAIALCVVALFAGGCGGGGGGGGNNAEALSDPCDVFPQGAVAKIINGSDCSSRTTPVARLDLFDDEDNRAVCTATVISSRHALTAAHCYSELVFKAGLVLNGRQYSVTRITPDPRYTGRFVDGRLLSDLAIIESRSALPPPFATLSFEDEAIETDLIYAFGFGTSVVGQSSLGRVNPLRAATLRISALSDLFVFNRYEQASDSNVCFGDSGGPAFVIDNGAPRVVGVTSTGSNATCAVGDTSAFTRLSSPGVREFIQGAVADLSARSSLANP